MKNNRRSFLKFSGLAGLSVSLSSLFQSYAHAEEKEKNYTFSGAGNNMCGYAAPRLDKVRVGLIGLGNRAAVHLSHMAVLDNVEITALCDIQPARVQEAQKTLGAKGANAKTYSGAKDEWKKLCDQEDIDLIYIITPWEWHTPMAIYAMQQGKHSAIEVPAAKTLDECWQLVETSEKTRRHCVILENCCYDSFELMTLNMARQNFFGEIVHCEGAYLHSLMQGIFAKNKYYDLWRLKENAKRNGNLYPTHGLGPISQVMNLNRGDKMDFLVSISGNDFMMHKKAAMLAAKDEFYQPYTNSSFRGNINTSIIKTNAGKTIMLQHDVTSPRPYSRIHLISGTEGTALKYPLAGTKGRISKAEPWTDADTWNKTPMPEWLSDEQYDKIAAQYTPEISKKLGAEAEKIGGHGGMDFLMNWKLIYCLSNGLPVDIDVYDAALWSSISALTQKSITNRSGSVDVPDFTRGNWKTNKPLDINAPFINEKINTEK